MNEAARLYACEARSVEVLLSHMHTWLTPYRGHTYDQPTTSSAITTTTTTATIATLLNHLDELYFVLMNDGLDWTGLDLKMEAALAQPSFIPSLSRSQQQQQQHISQPHTPSLVALEYHSIPHRDTPLVIPNPPLRVERERERACPSIVLEPSCRS